MTNNNRPIRIQTEDEYKLAYPTESRAIQMIAASCTGEIHIEYFQGNLDKVYVGNAVTSHVYVNDWTVIFQEIKLCF